MFTFTLVWCFISVYHSVWRWWLLTDVCWFDVMPNVLKMQHSAWLSEPVMGGWEAHEACVCSGKLLNCVCVYTKDHATENIILSCVYLEDLIGSRQRSRHEGPEVQRPQTLLLSLQQLHKINSRLVYLQLVAVVKSILWFSTCEFSHRFINIYIYIYKSRCQIIKLHKNIIWHWLKINIILYYKSVFILS